MAGVQPMTFLELVQRLRQEGRGPGASGTPVTVVSQVGDAKDQVDWIADAWLRIQMAKQSWRWLYAEKTVATNTTDRIYDLEDIFPVQADRDRFSHWKPKSFTYKVDSLGTDSERPIAQMLWEDYIRQDYASPQTVQFPTSVIVKPDNSLQILQKVSEVGTLKGRYYKSPQMLTANDDEPEMPARFHMLIVWTALVDHAVGDMSVEQLGRARERIKSLWFQLVNDQTEPVQNYARTLA